MDENLDDVKSQHLNKNPNVKTWTFKGNPNFDVSDLDGVRGFNEWMKDGIGFKVLSYQCLEDAVTFVLEKQPRTHVQR